MPYERWRGERKERDKRVRSACYCSVRAATAAAAADRTELV
jgi:hypothetical protein